MKAIYQKITAVVLAVLMILAAAVSVSAAEPYVHDPMDNPEAAKDIIVDPDAVYGYSPSPESTRLKEFADYDWTDESLVNGMREQREEYHESMQELYDMIRNMKEAGSSAEEIARAVSTRRNEIRLESYEGDPEGLAKVKQSNLETYGNENGGTPEFFFEKYGSWETVIEKSVSANPGADACLGLYDKYYDTYFVTVEELYTVQSGDTLEKIAQQYLGDKEQWPVLYEWNSGIIQDPNLIFPGQVLTVSGS